MGKLKEFWAIFIIREAGRFSWRPRSVALQHAFRTPSQFSLEKLKFFEFSGLRFLFLDLNLGFENSWFNIKTFYNDFKFFIPASDNFRWSSSKFADSHFCSGLFFPSVFCSRLFDTFQPCFASSFLKITCRNQLEYFCGSAYENF